ncbi:hypothetical protein AgCh_009624 [Apium graveolens]
MDIFDRKGQRIGSRGPSAVIGIPLERMDEVRKERKAKPMNYWTLGDIKTYWEVSMKYNPDARQIRAYERIDMQPGKVIDRKGTSA